MLRTIKDYDKIVKKMSSAQASKVTQEERSFVERIRRVAMNNPDVAREFSR